MSSSNKNTKVKVLTSFTAMINGEMIIASEGDEIEMPPGADWIKAKLVKSVSKETANTEKPKQEAKVEAPAAENLPPSKETVPAEPEK